MRLETQSLSKLCCRHSTNVDWRAPIEFAGAGQAANKYGIEAGIFYKPGCDFCCFLIICSDRDADAFWSSRGIPDHGKAQRAE